MRSSYRDVCDRCGEKAGKARHASQSCFCNACIELRRRERRAASAWDGQCRECGVDVHLTSKQASEARCRGYAYCSLKCSRAAIARVSSQTMARTNRKYASARMKAHNPMRLEETRNKVSATLRAIGHAPPVQGGNGRGLTGAQTMLVNALGAGWEAEHVVATKMGRYSGYPTNYKIDIAHPEKKIAIEVDGSSHSALARQEQDARKTELLQSMGWTVLRFRNAEVLADVDSAAALAMEACA